MDKAMKLLEATCIIGAATGVIIALALGGVHNAIIGGLFLVLAKAIRDEKECPKPCK